MPNKKTTSEVVAEYLRNLIDAFEEDIYDEKGILYKNGDSIYLQYPNETAVKITVTPLTDNLKETDNDPRSWDDQEPSED